MLITVSQETRDKLQKHPKPAGRVIEALLNKTNLDSEELIASLSKKKETAVFTNPEIGRGGIMDGS